MGRSNWRSEESSRSQHFLAGGALARELVGEAEIGPDDLVLDVGAGTGRLTIELARCARSVVAVETDGGLADRLRRRTADLSNVRVVQCDILDLVLPRERFKVVSNPPFHIATAILRHLLKPAGHLERADLVLSWGQAIGLTQVHPPSPAALRWQPWYELFLVRRLPAHCFRPAPSVDAAVISVRRRRRPLVEPERARDYWRYLSTRRERSGHSALGGIDVWQSVTDYRAGRGRR